MAAEKELNYSGWDVGFDTVIGRIGGKALLAFIMPPSCLSFARLVDKKDQGCVCAEFDDLERMPHRSRERRAGQGGAWWLFPAALADRGSERGDCARLERTLFPVEGMGGPVLDRCRAFYCDPCSSWQKPHIEQARALLRRALPKGSSFDGLARKDVDLICSHIDSCTRENLQGACPLDVAPAGLTDELSRAPGLEKIDPDRACPAPGLLER